MPMLRMAVLMASSLSACVNSVLSRVTMTGGVAAGASTAYHEGTTTPAMPCSAKVGMSGAAGARVLTVCDTSIREGVALGS